MNPRWLVTRLSTLSFPQELQAREDGLREKMEKQTLELQERKAAIEAKEKDLQTQSELLERRRRELEERVSVTLASFLHAWVKVA